MLKNCTEADPCSKSRGSLAGSAVGEKMQKVYNFFASIKLTVVLLLVLAATSIFGTVIPQDWQPFQYQQHFGDLGYRLIRFFSLTDMYHSWWFQLLLSFLVVNLLVCTFKRLPKTMKLMRITNPTISRERIEKMRIHESIKSQLSLDATLERVTETIKKGFPRLHVVHSDDTFKGLIAEKGRYSRFAVYVVHFSILLVFAGALIGSFTGFNGFMNINEGADSNVVVTFGKRKMIELPFKVRCDRFLVSFYKTGQPKDYVSKLSIIRDGRVVERKDVRVNDPLRYQDISFFQANYGTNLKGADITLVDPKTGKRLKVKLPYRDVVKIPGTLFRLELVDFKENLSGFGPALGVMIFKKGSDPTGSWILVNFPNFHGNLLGPYKVSVDSVQKRYYTGLQVKKDPGVWVVWLGCTLLLIAIALTFYTSHRRLWIRIEAANPGSVVYIAGNCSKNRGAFKKEFETLTRDIGKSLKKAG